MANENDNSKHASALFKFLGENPTVALVRARGGFGVPEEKSWEGRKYKVATASAEVTTTNGTKPCLISIDPDNCGGSVPSLEIDKNYLVSTQSMSLKSGVYQIKLTGRVLPLF